MSRNPEKSIIQTAATRRKILETGFRIFSERTIERVAMGDIAAEVGIGTATLYRYFGSKTALVLAVGTWMWEKYIVENVTTVETAGKTAGEMLKDYLDSFLNLYRNHRDMLRFNQFFNIYVMNEDVPEDMLTPYMKLNRVLANRFHTTYLTALKDGTVRTELPEEEMFSTILHLMLAVTTRYAVGLVCVEGTVFEKELILQRNMLLREFLTVPPEKTEA